jgi:hypothetical protein
MHDGVLDCDARYIRAQQCIEENTGLQHPHPPNIAVALVEPLVCQPLNAAVRQICAGRVRDHQVPPIVDNVHDITLVVHTVRSFGRKIVAGDCVMSFLREGVSDYAGELTSNKYTHSQDPFFMAEQLTRVNTPDYSNRANSPKYFIAAVL